MTNFASRTKLGRRLLGVSALGITLALTTPIGASAAPDDVAREFSVLGAEAMPARPALPLAFSGANDAKIVNGTPVDISAAPYAGIVSINNSALCTGSLVASQWVITAAHCVSDTNGVLLAPTAFNVVLGKTKQSSVVPADRRLVAEVVRHPNYNKTTNVNDVALLKLSSVATGIAPVALNTDAYVPSKNAALSAYGWGRTVNGGPAADNLQYGAMSYINSTKCGSWAATQFTALYMVCAQGKTPAGAIIDTCNGDSGGPLVAAVAGTTKLVGLTSFGSPTCGNANAPGVYTRVSAIAGWANAVIAGQAPTIQSLEPVNTGTGYWFVASDGGVFTFGNAGFFGSTGAMRLNQPVVGMARTPSGKGYWLVARDGGIFTFGDARFFGSTGNIVLNQPIVGMAATPTGRGYWMVAADGGVFTFGDAAFLGSGATQRRTDFASITPAVDGQGYALMTGSGDVFMFGSLGGSAYCLNSGAPMRRVVFNTAKTGAWFFNTKGRVCNVGSVVHKGDMSATALNKPVVDGGVTPTNNGYWMIASDGGVFTFGDAKFYGSTGAMRLNQPIVGMAIS